MYKAAILGATGVVGQEFILALQDHPWFTITRLGASERSAGKSYREALQDANGSTRWYCSGAPKPDIQNMVVEDASKMDMANIDVVFTAVESEEAKHLEPRFAAHKPVITTASAFRYEEDVPIMIPGINSAHSALIKKQRDRGWNGFIVPGPNCTTVGLAASLKPIQQSFGLNQVIMTSLQAVSGAGRDGGVLALDITDNVIPYIPWEEEKVQRETKKILGTLNNGHIEPLEFAISCTCTRVNVRDAHLETVFVSTKKPCTPADVKKAMVDYGRRISDNGWPSAPKELIVVLDDPFRPQPRVDRDTYDGMAVVVGRIEQAAALENGIKYVVLSHNLKLGAAKGAVLIGEQLAKEGYIKEG